MEKLGGIIMTKVSVGGGTIIADDNLDFGDKDFSVLGPTGPIEFYVDKLFVCPVCGFEAQHHTNLRGEPKNSPFCPVCFKKTNIPVMLLKGEK